MVSANPTHRNESLEPEDALTAATVALEDVQHLGDEIKETVRLLRWFHARKFPSAGDPIFEEVTEANSDASTQLETVKELANNLLIAIALAENQLDSSIVKTTLP